MRVFVLSTGRCGSTTFARACSHLEGLTSGHETIWATHGEARFAYPDDHIEVDNRLSWHLGQLGERFPDARWVHLQRDPAEVAASYVRRWRVDPLWPSTGSLKSDIRLRRDKLLAPLEQGIGIIEGFAYGILNRWKPWPEDRRLEVGRFYAETVNANIREFLRYRDAYNVHLENAAEDFRGFCEWIGVEQDVDRAVAEWGTRHNATPEDRDRHAR